MQLYRTVRRTAQPLLLAALLGLASATVCWAADAGTVVRKRGEASTGGKALNTGDAVAIGARLRTGKGARLEVKLLDGTDLTLGESADFVIDELVLTADSGNAVFRRLAGSFQMVAGAIAEGEEERMRVRGHGVFVLVRAAVIRVLFLAAINTTVRRRAPQLPLHVAEPGASSRVVHGRKGLHTRIQFRAHVRQLLGAHEHARVHPRRAGAARRRGGGERGEQQR
jgi:hypothetical protein